MFRDPKWEVRTASVQALREVIIEVDEEQIKEEEVVKERTTNRGQEERLKLEEMDLEKIAEKEEKLLAETKEEVRQDCTQ